MNTTSFLVIGAGPYGIAAAAYAKSLGVDVTIVGAPLEAWKMHMPRGMYLRSATDWHLDARAIATFDAFARRRGLQPEQVQPVPLHTFVDYASWFMGQYDVSVCAAKVVLLQKAPQHYIATLDDGSTIAAQRVLMAPGFAPFKYYPSDLTARLPQHSFTHTSDAVDFEQFRNRRVLIVGGRQSAFEWAALANETGAQKIHLAHRHATPQFAPSDWSWVQPLVRRTLTDHGWWRTLPQVEQDRIGRDLWSAGRLTLEPWLEPRVRQPNIVIHERTEIVSATRAESGSLNILLEDDTRFAVDYIMLATGYRPDIARLAWLDRHTILDRLISVDGHPMLDTEFQTNLPGLYVAGLAATRDFGPFLGFTVACPVAARIIGDHVAAQCLPSRGSSRAPGAVDRQHADALP